MTKSRKLNKKIIIMAFKRQTAYRMSIGQLYNGNLSMDENRFNYIETGGKKVSRVSLVGNVVDKYVSEGKPYVALTIDDGTEQIRIKIFDKPEMAKEVDIGDTILVIGVLRYFNEEIYILPEIIRKLDVKWTLARRLELEKEYGKEQLEQLQRPAPEIPAMSEEDKEYVLEKVEEEKIGKNEKGEEESGVKSEIMKIILANEAGIDIEKIILTLKHPVAEINSAISELIEEGKIYEPQPGKVRAI